MSYDLEIMRKSRDYYYTACVNQQKRIDKMTRHIFDMRLLAFVGWVMAFVGIFV